ncbi:MAG: type II toxin-antitoxin system HicA family toxin [Caldilineaceae bacterium SB0661_bin_32]|uniref:Type II toxin-antitoxin system HicA family toxin n=1 Tax=Caldilineaceae bacterium SB0661_bin_32 TaxID=2605255 RepID=A0A6B1D338_9CHLR|nr:type II toxin-antitoxin system HicA family toxin [Caldilineaceae bacterium SB0661_bin_32]
MARLRVLSGREIRRILTKNGFSVVRRRGSHVIMRKPVPGATITVPVPDHKELRTGTLMSIIRQSGLPRELFE